MNRLIPLVCLSLLPAWTALALTSDQVQTKDIYQVIRAEYDAETGSQKLQVVFRDGGLLAETMELAATDSVSIDGRVVPSYYREWTGSTLYRFVTSSTPYSAAPHVFTFKRGAMSFTNSYAIRAIDFEAPQQMRLSQGLKLKISGPALGAGEIVSVSLENTSDYSSASKTFDGAPGLTTLSLSAQDLATLKPGPVQLRVTRSSGGRVAKSTAAGGSSFVYYSASPRSLQVLP